MGKFNRGDRSGGGRKFGGDRGFNRRGGSDRPAMFQAVCSECHADCEVPFKPTGSKPVLCSHCFGKKDSSGRGFDRRSSSRSDFAEKRMFRAVCDKCHKDCEVPFKPSNDKPIFCNECFDRGDNKRGGNSNAINYSSEFKDLNRKLDILIKLLSPKEKVETKEEKKPVVEKKKEVKKIAKKEIAKPKKKVATAKKPAKKAAKKKTVTKKKVTKKK